MPKVYIVNDLNHDFYKAEKFGKLVYITEGKMPIFKTDVIRTLMQNKMKDFNEDDYLLVTGPALMCIMATLIVVGLFTEKFISTQVKLLVFDAKEQEYIVRHV
jgi:predicted ATPase